MNRRALDSDLAPVVLAAAVGAALAAVDLGTRSLWLDEGSTAAIVAQHGAALWRAVAHDGGNMLLYYLALHGLVAAFGDATWLLRLPSALATGLTGGLTAALALRLFPGRRPLAAAAGLLAVVSLPVIYWGQNARGYAWLVALSTGSFLALLAILQTPGDRAPSRRAISGYVLCTLAAVYTGYDAVLLLPAQLAILLLHRDRARPVLGALAAVALLSLPLVVLAADRGSGQLFWVTPLSWRIAGQAALGLLSAGLPPNFHATVVAAPAVGLAGLALLAALGLAARTRGGALRFLLAWALIPPALTVVAYALGTPIELPRVTILELPAVALLLAWLWLRPGVRPAVGLAALAVLLGLRAVPVVSAYGVSPEPWDAATAYVLASTSAARPGCVVFYPQDGREAVDYYLRRHPGSTADPAPDLRPVLPSLPWSATRPFIEAYATLAPRDLRRVARRCPRLWVISSHGGQAHGTAGSVAHLRRYHALEARLRARYAGTSARTFGYAAPIVVRLYRMGAGP